MQTAARPPTCGRSPPARSLVSPTCAPDAVAGTLSPRRGLEGESTGCHAVRIRTSVLRTDARKVRDGTLSYHSVYPLSITRAAPVM